jgi:serralysin
MKAPCVLILTVCLVLLATLIGHERAEAGSHLWRFNEVFSNADGTVQFIEMQECCGSTIERALGDKWILAVGADHQYTFPNNISGDTSHKYLLLATQGYADLPGVPVPDFIIPDGFLPVDGETLEYWLYSAATWTYGPLPTDGVTSMQQDGSTDVNSPTNYAGETGMVDLTVPVIQSTWGGIKAGDRDN